MAVHLSREEGRFSLLLRKPVWLEAGDLAAPLALALRVPRSDTVRMCRLQRGILFQGATEEAAARALAVLAEGGVEAEVVPDADVPLLGRALEPMVVEFTEEGLRTPSLAGAGLPALWPWDALAMVSAGIQADPGADAEGFLGGIDRDLLQEAEVRKAGARRRLERARERVYPLREVLAKSEPQAAELLARHAGKAGDEDPHRRVRTRLDLIFTRPFERIRLTEQCRALGRDHSAWPARNLQAMLKELVALAPQAGLTGASLALLHEADAGDYLFDDDATFDDYCRWSWRQRLVAGEPSESEEAADA